MVYLGFLITLFLFKGINFLERLAYSFLFGTGSYPLLLFCASILGTRITLVSATILLLAPIIILKLLTLRFKFKIKVREIILLFNFKTFSPSEKIMLLMILLLIIFSILLASYWPIYEWDALALYDFRGRVIAYTGELLGTIGKSDYFSHYPPLTSILHAFIYIFGGKNPQYIYPLYYASFISIFYFRLVEFSKRNIALYTTLVLASLPIIFHHSTFAYTNLPYAAYFFIGTIYVYLFAIKSDKRYLWVSAIAMGLGTWTRGFEPFWIPNILFLTGLIFWNKDYRRLGVYISYLLIFFPIQQLWAIYLERFLGKDYSTVGVISSGASTVLYKMNLAKLLEITTFIYQNIILSWGIMLILFCSIVLGELKIILNSPRRIILLVLIAINLLILIGGAYFFSFAVPSWKEIPDSARRMAMIFIPIFIYFIGCSRFMQDAYKIFDKIFHSQKL